MSDTKNTETTVSTNKKTWSNELIGGFWKRQSRTDSAKKYLAGRITLTDSLGQKNDYRIQVWPARNKEKETSFDLLCYLEDGNANKVIKEKQKKEEVVASDDVL